MNKSRSRMEIALKALVIPVLRERGFTGFMPHFRRITAEYVHLISFQFDQYGGGFVIEVAIAPNAPLITKWKGTIAANKMSAHDLAERLRLHPKGILKNSSTDDWFRYDQMLPRIFGNPYTRVAKQVLKVLALAENYWENRHKTALP